MSEKIWGIIRQNKFNLSDKEAVNAIKDLITEEKIAELEKMTVYFPMNIDQTDKLMKRIDTLKESRKEI